MPVKLTDTIRNYTCTEPLPSELIKTSREYYSLAVLKYSFPETFSTLQKAEAPDLQDLNGSTGVEVAWGGSQRDEYISGESIKYAKAKTKAEKEKILMKIRKKGGNRDEISTTYPLTTAEHDLCNIKSVFNKKSKKTNAYRECVKHLGLAIIMDIPLFFFCDFDWGKLLVEYNNNSFDFVVLIHWSGADLYDFIDDKYSSCRIERNDMEALKKLGRMAAEGLISDDDTIWY